MVRVSESRRAEIRRFYRVARAAVGKRGLTQGAVEQAARAVYPEFGSGRFWRIENADTFPTPSERKALAKVLKVNEADLPSEQVMAKSA